MVCSEVGVAAIQTATRGHSPVRNESGGPDLSRVTVHIAHETKFHFATLLIGPYENIQNFQERIDES